MDIIETHVSFGYISWSMRLSVSIALWLMAAVLILLGGHGWIQLRKEEADLEAVAQRELVLVTTAIRSAVENAIRDSQEPDVTKLFERLEVKDPAFDVFVIADDGAVLGSSWGAGGNLGKAHALADAVGPRDALLVEGLATGELAAVASLHVDGASVGRLVVIRPMNMLEADLNDERRAIVLSLGLLITALLLIIWSVIRFRVHVPMSHIIAGVRQIRSGELSARIGLPGKDEFAELAREFDAMTGSLEQARLDLARAAEAREWLELEMQRANKLAVVGEIAATLAHEIGSPLQVLNGRARDLAAREDLPKDAARSAAILVEQTDRVHDIVERLLDVARRKASAPTELDIRDVVRQMVELVSTHARREGVRLEVDCEDVPCCEGDAAQIQQVVLNLLQNALRATDRGGVIRVTVSESSFTCRSGAWPRRSVAVAIEDTGSGISEAIVDRIFEPFFTAWAGDHEQKGTGLGLAVVKSIVKEHGGHVRVCAPSLGTGARIVVHFPAPNGQVEQAT